MAPATQKVIVTVPAREGFPGRHRGGRFWPNGRTEAEVTDEQLAALKADPLIAVTTAADAETLASTLAPGAAKRGPGEADMKAAVERIAQLEKVVADARGQIDGLAIENEKLRKANADGTAQVAQLQKDLDAATKPASRR